MVTTTTVNNFSYWGALFEMAKPRITLLLEIIAAATFLALGGFGPQGTGWWGLAKLLIAVGILSVGIFTLNHWIERFSDRDMARTRERPLAAGRFPATPALVWGLFMTGLGVVVSTVAINLTMGVVALLTAVGYLVVYTPLKYKTVFHTTLGALPGATPPLAGALAATGVLTGPAWLMFGLLVLWQFPHFLAIELIYKDDYGRGGVKVAPVVDSSGVWTNLQIVGATLGLLVLTGWLFPLGPLFAMGLVLTLVFLAVGVRAVVTGTKRAAKTLFRTSLLYLPLYFVLLILQFQIVKEAWHG